MPPRPPRHDPWNDPVTISPAEHRRDTKATFNDVELSDGREESIYRPINQSLSFQCLTHSKLLSDNPALPPKYLSVGPQGPVFYYGPPSDTASAVLPTEIARDVKEQPRQRTATDPTELENGGRILTDMLIDSHFRPEYHNHEEHDFIYNEYLDEEAANPLFETSFQTGDSSSSGPSAAFPQITPAVRLIDFNLYVNLRYELDAAGVIVCIVEIKPLPFMVPGFSLKQLIRQAMNAMLPQVVQQVQFVFAQQKGILNEVFAFLFVSSYVKVLRFTRTRVPALDCDADEVPPVFSFGPSSKRDIARIADSDTRGEWFRIFDEKTDDYDVRFKKAFDRVVRLANRTQLPQRQPRAQGPAQAAVPPQAQGPPQAAAPAQAQP